MKSILAWLEGFGVNTAILLAVVGLLLAALTASALDISAPRWLGFFFATMSLWLPYILFNYFHHKWIEYIQRDFDFRQGRVTLEIQFPQEVMKSPLAMEMVLNQMYQAASPDNLVETYWDGKHPPVYGLEIVSDGGRIHFYISTPVKKFKNIVEAQLYAHYPGIIVTQLATDYTAYAPWNPDAATFSIHYRLKKPNAYPIKTYIDFGLDKDPKEEFKIDPIATTLEVLGSLTAKEKIWVQILISANRTENFTVGSLHTHPDWEAEVVAEINKLAQRDDKKKGEVEFESAPRVTPGERDTIAAMERHLSKPAFNTKIRTMYLAEDFTNFSDRVGATITMWRAYEDKRRNGIGIAWRTDFNWNWWQDPSGKRRAALKKQELFEYKIRYYEQQDFLDGGFIMTTEELATLFHPAGQVILTPSLERVPSARAEAPANLPYAPSA